MQTNLVWYVRYACYELLASCYDLETGARSPARHGVRAHIPLSSVLIANLIQELRKDVRESDPSPPRNRAERGGTKAAGRQFGATRIWSGIPWGGSPFKNSFRPARTLNLGIAEQETPFSRRVV